MARTIWMWRAAALGIILVLGATVLKISELTLPGLLGALLRSEWIHIPAHLALYGSLAICCRRAVGPRLWLVVATVGAVALLQEAAQSLLVGRAMGGSEAFDLAVDTVALVVALAFIDPPPQSRMVQ
jgi:hypothetical protein